MKVAELIERLKDVDPESIVYLDDTEMPTLLCLVHIEAEVCRSVGLDTGKEFQLPIVTLSTYNWREDQDDNP